MPVKMIALGRYYDSSTSKEYRHGAEFHVADDKAADRLERIHKAKRCVEKVEKKVEAPAPPPAPEPVVDESPAPTRSYTRRVMTLDPEVTNTPEPEPAAESSEAEVAKIPTSRLGRYRRNDMRSED